MPGTPWTHAEIVILRTHWRKVRSLVLRALLPSRSHSALRHQVIRQGLTRPRLSVPRLRQLHRNGHCPGEIVRRTGWSKSTVRTTLHRLGITPHRGDTGAAQARRLCRQAKAQGYKRWGDYLNARKRLKYDAIVPGCRNRAQVRLVQFLREHGPTCLADVVRLQPTKWGRESARRELPRLVAWRVLVERDGVLSVAKRRAS